jgi:hypothetical protein
MPSPHHEQRNRNDRAAPRQSVAARGGASVIRGTARNVQLRNIASKTPMEVLSFRVQQFDSAGNRLDSVPVELGSGISFSGHRISGQLNDGDDVEVHGVWSNGTLQAEGVANHTTGARITPHTGWEAMSQSLQGKAGKRVRKALIVGLGIAATFVVVVVVFLAVVIHEGSSDFDEFRQNMDQQSQQSKKNWCLDIRDSGMSLPHECDGVL